MQKPFLNLGCGRVILPAPKPEHHRLIPDGIHQYALWVNADKVRSAGVDHVIDLFSYPWQWGDDSFDGALLTHLVEHIPHELNDLKSKLDYWDKAYGQHLLSAEAYNAELQKIYRVQDSPDGFYAFFSELHRVLTPGAVAHIIVPYAFSTGAMQDPTHRRYLVPESFSYLEPNPDAPFVLPDGGNWKIETLNMGITSLAEPFQHNPDLLQKAILTQWNTASEFYISLRCVK